MPCASAGAASVAAAFSLDLDPEGKIRHFKAGFGGIARTPLGGASLERLALGRAWDESTLALLLSEAEALGTPQSDLRGSAAYRRALLGKLLERFYYETASRSEAAE